MSEKSITDYRSCSFTSKGCFSRCRDIQNSLPFCSETQYYWKAGCSFFVDSKFVNLHELKWKLADNQRMIILL